MHNQDRNNPKYSWCGELQASIGSAGLYLGWAVVVFVLMNAAVLEAQVKQLKPLDLAKRLGLATFPAERFASLDLESNKDVLSVCFIPNSKRIAAAEKDGHVVMWDTAKQGQFIRERVGRFGGVYLAVTADGSLLAAAAHGQVVLLDPTTLKKKQTIPVGHHINRLAFSADGKRMLVSAVGTQVSLIDIKLGQVTSRFNSICHFLHGLEFSADGKSAFMSGQPKKGAGNKGLVKWNLATTKHEWGLNTTSIVARLWELPNRRLASIGPRQQVCLWSAKGESIRKFPKGIGLKNAISQDGTKLAFFDNGDAKVWLYDLNRKDALLGVFATDTNAESIAMSPSGDRLVIGDGNGVLHLWNLKFPNGNEPLADLTEAQRNALEKPAVRVSEPNEYGVVHLDGHRKTILSTSMLPGGKQFVSSGVDRTIVWSLQDQKVVLRKDYLGTQAGDMIFGLKALPNGTHLLAAFGQYKGTHGVHLLDLKTLKRTSKLPGVVDTAHEVAVSPKGLLLAAAGHGHDLVVWDAKTLKEKWRRKTIPNRNRLGVFSIEFSTDGNFVLMSTADNLIVLDVDNGAVIKSRRISQPQVIRRRPGLDQALIDTGRTVEIVSVPLLQPMMSIPVSSHIDKAAFSEDGNRVAWSGPRELVVWDIKNKRNLLVESREFEIKGLELTPDGKTLVVAEGSRIRVIPVP